MSTSKKSASKRPEKRGAKVTTKKPSKAAKASKPKGRTAVYDATKDRAAAATKPSAPAPKTKPAKGRPTSGADAYEHPTIDAPPRGDDEGKKKPRASVGEAVDVDWGTTEGPEAKTIPGEAINGAHLARCIRFAAKVAPKKGGQIVFTHTDKGTALVSGHDQRRVHTGFLVEGAAMLADIAVPRADAVKLADALEGLDGPLVRIDAKGCVLVHHGTAQPPLHFNLGNAPITQAWEGPSLEGRLAARVPLRIPAAWQSVACRWPDAISQSFQSDDGIEFLSISDAETGTLLARAALAQEGRDLFPEDQRQTEIPGSRTAGAKPVVADTVGGTVRVEVSGGATKVVATKPDDTVSITSEAAPAAPSAAPPKPALGVADPVSTWPTPGRLPVVIEVPDTIWDGLSPDALAGLHEPLTASGPKVGWLSGEVGTRSVTINPLHIGTLVARLAALGLCLGSRKQGTFDGILADHWIAGIAS